MLGARLSVAVLPSPKGPAQPRGDSAEQRSRSPPLQRGLARLPPANRSEMELQPPLHKAVKHAVLISYSNDDLPDKQCAIPCKWRCHGSVNFLWRLSCVGINEMLPSPQNTNCRAKIIAKGREREVLEYFAQARHLAMLVRKSQRCAVLYQLNYYFFYGVKAHSVRPSSELGLGLWTAL